MARVISVVSGGVGSVMDLKSIDRAAIYAEMAAGALSVGQVMGPDV